MRKIIWTLVWGRRASIKGQKLSSRIRWISNHSNTPNTIKCIEMEKVLLLEEWSMMGLGNKLHSLFYPNILTILIQMLFKATCQIAKWFNKWIRIWTSRNFHQASIIICHLLNTFMVVSLRDLIRRVSSLSQWLECTIILSHLLLPKLDFQWITQLPKVMIQLCLK